MTDGTAITSHQGQSDSEWLDDLFGDANRLSQMFRAAPALTERLMASKSFREGFMVRPETCWILLNTPADDDMQFEAERPASLRSRLDAARLGSILEDTAKTEQLFAQKWHLAERVADNKTFVAEAKRQPQTYRAFLKEAQKRFKATPDTDYLRLNAMIADELDGVAARPGLPGGLTEPTGPSR